jgi:hypothetical protein
MPFELRPIALHYSQNYQTLNKCQGDYPSSLFHPRQNAIAIGWMNDFLRHHECNSKGYLPAKEEREETSLLDGRAFPQEGRNSPMVQADSIIRVSW